MPYGYHGKILHVNLDKERIEIESPDDSFYRKYIGGSALGAYYLLKQTPSNISPFDPRNTLVFALSILTGAPISGQSRMTMVAKSPLTEAIGDSQCGGFFPAEMKFSGFDAIVVVGQAKSPKYLWIHDGEAELRDASRIWGCLTGKAEMIIRDELDDEKVEVLQIGPAGEKLVRFSAVMNMCNRANGRTGMGAVMGSKKLKAIVVRGMCKPLLADRDELLRLSKWGSDHFEESNLYGLRMLGTAGDVASMHEKGMLPTHNWRSGFFTGWQSIDGKTMADTILKGRDTCYACTVRCKRIVEVTEGPYKLNPHYGGPEYETIAAFGSYCDITDLNAIAYANQLCNMYGMDTISCGATIAWVMDCFEAGILTKEDTGGLEIRYGDEKMMVRLTELIGKREGFGDILAEGSARAARKFGQDAMDRVAAVKNQELPGHTARVKRSLSLIYGVNPIGADHQSSDHDPSYIKFPERMAEIGLTNPQPINSMNEEKVRFALITQYVYSCLDSINMCQFIVGAAWQLYNLRQLTQIIKAVTGWNVSIDELLLIGARRLNMLRAFNARDGIGRDADTLPKKLQQPMIGGPTDGLVVTLDEFERAKDWYYEMAGWDVTTGFPTRPRLEELGLDWVANELGLK